MLPYSRHTGLLPPNYLDRFQPVQAEILPRETRFSERATDWIARQLGGDRSAYNRARDITGLLDFLPGYGDAVAADEAGAAYRAGNFGEAGLLGGAAILGVVPGAGDAAAQVIRKGVRAAKNAPRAIVGAADAAFPSTREAIAAEREASFTPQETEKLREIKRENPSFGRAAMYMHPVELRAVMNNPRAIEATTRLLDVLPSAKNVAATAKFGAPKRGWYAASANAVHDVFGPDAPRFTALLAATSPQTSVESNLRNTLSIWRNWTAAGRPTDAASIKKIMGDSVQGSRGEDSVLGSWVNNSVRALSAPDPAKVVLSGPKVDSFYRNLTNDVLRVTNDAHMANFTGLDQGLFRVSPSEAQLASGNPGMTPGYAATSARMRQGGDIVGMNPAEVQETTWSVAMPMIEQANSLGVAVPDLVQQGRLTPDIMRGTPDFSTLLNTGENRNILEQAGYGQQLDNLVPFQWPTNLPDLTLAEQNEVMKTARRLEALRALRGRESAARYSHRGGPNRGETGFVYMPAEGVPGAGVGHAEGLITAPLSVRDVATQETASAFKDQAGHDILMRSAGFNTIRQRPTQGVFQPPGGGPIETQPGFASGAQVRVRGVNNPAMSDYEQEKLRAIATLRGGMTAQHGSPYFGLVPREGGENLIQPGGDRVPLENMKQWAEKFGASDKAAVDTGAGVGLLNFSDEPIDDAVRADVQSLLGTPIKRKADVGKPVDARKFTTDDYIDLSEEWLNPPGSGKVARRIIDKLGDLKKADFKRIDSKQLRQAAADLHKLYSRQKAKGMALRPDLMNMLEIIRDKGLAGLRAAVDNKEFLPAIAAVGLAPTVFQLSQSDPRAEQRPPAQVGSLL